MSYLIRVMVGDDEVHKIITEEKKKVTVGSGYKNDVVISSWKNGQLTFVIQKGLLNITGKDIPDCKKLQLSESDVASTVSEAFQVSVNWLTYTGKAMKEFSLPYWGVVLIGRSKDNTIRIHQPTISGHHAVIRCEDGTIRVEDGYEGKASANGVFLNGKRIRKALMKSGDVLDLTNVRITLTNTHFQFENVGDTLFLETTAENGTLSYSSTLLTKNTLEEPNYRRSPRIREGLPCKTIVMQRAPAKGSGFQKRRGMFTTLLSSGAMLGVSVATGMASPALLAARAAGLIAPVANMAVNSGDNRKGKKTAEKQLRERMQKYGAYIEAQKSLIQLTAEQQRRILRSENPAPAEWISAVHELRSNLWERRPEDSDFLHLRIGMGYEPLCVEVKAPADSSGFQMEEDEVEELANQIIEETRIVDDIPARISLREYQTIGVVGNRSEVITLVKNMLISLTAAHSRDDVQIVGIFDDSERRQWEQLRWFPHMWDGERESRFLAFSQQEEEHISDTLYETIRLRNNIREDQEHLAVSPHYVFLLGSYQYMRYSKLLPELLHNSSAAGVTTLFLYNLDNIPAHLQRTYLPPACQFVIDLDDINGPAAYEFARAERKFMFSPDPEIDSSAYDEFARRMSAIRTDSGSGKAELPAGITFLEGLKVSNVREIPVWENWSNTNKKKVLAAPIAILPTGKMLELDIGDFNEPPVSLVAGMSGSGKSEFLKTWILSLAVQYSPEELSMVIIDYKGGSMANSVEDLPHVVGKITDIESGDIMRPLASLAYELSRRLKLFKQLGVLDYKEYSKGKRVGKFTDTLPMLLIVCDEFAELKLQHREFMTELIRIARLGRACGVRLILATQSPAGVVDQDLFDNSHLQICLKVQNAAASKAMILVADAARITQNGRAFIRTGNDDSIVMVQSYWTGAPYISNREKNQSVGNTVRLVNITGERIKTVVEEKTRFKSEVNELQMIIRYINTITRDHAVQTIACPWKPELPILLNLPNLHENMGFDGVKWTPTLDWLQVPIGWYDIPSLQEQGIQYVDFEKDGHLGIYGLPGRGKTILLKTLLLGLGLFWSPKDVNIYILDLGSQTLRMFEEMPHVAGVALGTQEDRMKKIVAMLEGVLAERKEIFAEYRTSSLKNYREQFSDDMPAIVLAIDNFTPLFEACPEIEPLIYQIGNEGAGFGIYLVYTANTNSTIRYKLTQNVNNGIAFELNTKTEYNDVVGHVESVQALAGVRGRGFIKNSDCPIVFQAAVYGMGNNEQQWNEWSEQQIRQMQAVWDGPAVNKVPVVPNKLIVEDMLHEYAKVDFLPIGADCSEAKPVFLNLKDKPLWLVAGDAGSGTSKLLKSIGHVLSQKSDDNHLYVIDGQFGDLSAIQQWGADYVSVDDLNGISCVVTEIVQELIRRQKGEKEMKPQICLLIDDIQTMIESIDGDDLIYRRVNAMVKNAEGLGICIIAGAEREALEELHTINPIVSHMVQAQNAVILSDSVSAYTYFQQSNLSYEERTNPLKQNNAWMVTDGTALKFKPMEE